MVLLFYFAWNLIVFIVFISFSYFPLICCHKNTLIFLHCFNIPLVPSYIIFILTIFSSQCFCLRKKCVSHFVLKMHQNWHMSFFYDIFNKKNLINFLVKNFIKKTHMSILMHFLDKMAHLFFLKMGMLRSES